MIFKVYKIFPLALILFLVIGIISNIFVPFTLAMNGLLIISSLMIWRNWRKMKHAADKISRKNMNLIIAIGLLMIVIIQLLVLKYLPATVYHDPFRVLHQAELLNTNNHNWGETTYFWRYPNNVPIAYFVSLWFIFTDLLNLTHNVSIHILSMFFLDSFIVMGLYTVKKIYRRNIGILASIIFLVFGPFAYTYYLQVFYTDLPNMLFILIVFNLINSWANMTRTKKILSGIAIVILMLLGQLLKPNLIIFAVAISIIIVGFFIINRQVARKLIVPLLLVLVGLILATPVKTGIQNTTGFVPNTKYQLPTTHWIWMSYNPESPGSYVGRDVHEILEYPTKKKRANYINKALPKRFKELGPLGLIQKWVTKIGLLLNVDSISSAYTGGYMQTPKVYANIQFGINFASQFIMRLGFILIYAIGLLRAIKMFGEKQEEVNIIQALAAITIVGFMMFHVFLWEAGARYGQIVVPLLLMMNVGTDVDLRKQVQLSRLKIFLPLGIIASLIAILIVPTTILPHGPVFVSAQRSQLSQQYGARPTAIDGNKIINQKITINHQVTELAVLAPANDNLKAELVNLKTGNIQPMHHDKKIVYINKVIKPGDYKIRFTAKDNSKPFKVITTNMQKYKLANYPLIVNDKEYKYRSLIYQASYFR
ncbi:membrane protein [Companilactobacillus sp. RD055328]|uniref:hypothetical protein n=1 Tax=Companilactobacillus sp. RD055328 TaxID=2916634 RepID=UPI001FC7F157|nr:hypothetical protein [Companilactobacillus sp. RD055328]GKQ42392.1 membrane protein [Companilactobacillus sp. RD055328]